MCTCRGMCVCVCVSIADCNVSLAADIGNPYSLDVFEGHVYWTTKERGEVWKMDKFGNGNKVKVLTINPWLTQVRIYQEHRHNHSGERTGQGLGQGLGQDQGLGSQVLSTSSPLSAEPLQGHLQPPVLAAPGRLHLYLSSGLLPDRLQLQPVRRRYASVASLFPHVS